MNTDFTDRPIMEIIKGIKAKTIDLKLLDKTTKIRCTEFLSSECYSEAQIASILDVSERTIRRYLHSIRASNALSPDMNWAKTVIGNIYYKTEQQVTYLFKLSKASEANIREKIQACVASSKVYNDFIKRLQGLGYLPSTSFSMQLMEEEKNKDVPAAKESRKYDWIPDSALEFFDLMEPLERERLINAIERRLAYEKEHPEGKPKENESA